MEKCIEDIKKDIDLDSYKKFLIECKAKKIKVPEKIKLFILKDIEK